MSHNFQVNLRGVIDLLSHHLYSGPEVFVRELLQNAVDAITARSAADASFKDGRVSFQLVGNDAGGDSPTLIVEDNGVGLSEPQVHQFLATIGASSKRDELNEQRQEFLGQFGIGLLSCFMVADEIVMITRSALPDTKPVEWRGRPDGTYTLRTLDRDMSPGTTVYLRARYVAKSYYESVSLKELILHFGEMLEVPIFFRNGEVEKRLNDKAAPWNLGGIRSEEERQFVLETGSELLQEKFLDCVPLRDADGFVDGVAYILSHATSPGAKANHRVYLKGMLLSETIDDLLPQWAVFVRVIANVNGLRPIASREGFVEDDQYEKTRDNLGTALRRYLMDLATHDPDRLRYLIDLHHLAIRGLASSDERCFKVFAEMLPFETSVGRMTLGEYLREYKTVYYVNSRDEFRQVAQVASAQNIPVINAGYVYDSDLMAMLSVVNGQVTVERLDATSLMHQLEDVSLDDRDKAFDLLRTADVVLQPFHCAADVKAFEPAHLPTLYTTEPRGGFMRQVEQTAETSNDLWADLVTSAVGRSESSAVYARLCLNHNNPLIARLIGISDKRLLKRAIEMLYVQALLMGHHPLSAREMSLLNDGLLAMIEDATSSVASSDE